jgi:hypothetical protein
MPGASEGALRAVGPQRGGVIMVSVAQRRHQAGIVIVLLGGGVASVRAGTIAISEFLNNPGVTEVSEWVELYNYGSEAVDLSGWSIADEGIDNALLPNIVLPSGGYLILTGDRAEFLADWFGGADLAFVQELSSGFVLANATDQLVLRDALDQIVWNLAWSNDESSGLATFLTATDFAVTNFGTADAPGVSRSGDDLGLPGFLGYQQNNFTADPFAFFSTSGDFGSPMEGSYSVLPAPGGLVLATVAVFWRRRGRRRRQLMSDPEITHARTRKNWLQV